MSSDRQSEADAKRIFGDDAESYDAGRLDYPSRVYEVLSQRCGLRPGVRVFEVGAGSGIATRRILQFGVSKVIAIEPDERLANFLLKSLPSGEMRVEVKIETFEDAQLPAGCFDVGLAATSFHWLDPGSALKKIAGLLKPGGWWAMFWNIYRGIDGLDEFSKAIDRLYDEFDIMSNDGGELVPFALQTEKRLGELNAAGFVNASFETIPWKIRLSAQKLRSLYSTFSPIRKLGSTERATFLDGLERVAKEKFGGAPERSYISQVYTAQRTIS